MQKTSPLIAMTKAKNKLENYSPLVRKLLSARGITTKKEAEIFLHPDWSRDIGDPFGILGMERAVDRILLAIDNNEQILIYGDYDCDGIPGSVLLHDFFKKIGYKNFSNYIPHRFEEGYGFHTDAVIRAKGENVALIITVDVGITAFDAVNKAQELHVDVILTDHHLPVEENGKQKIPNAFAVLNSKQTADSYPDDMLCGAGVAFKLVQALLQKGHKEGRFSGVPDGWEKWLLDMAGLSTIADMVPLQKENRTLSYFGLQVMRRSRRKGLMALLQKINVDQKNLTEDDIGFMIGPRINAASRIDHPLRAFELLSASTDADAIQLANYLDGINDKRKGIVGGMVKEAKRKLAAREVHSVVVLGNPLWHPGLVGLVATKIVEELSCTAFVWGRDGNGVIKGSCRSAGDVSVVELMRATPSGTFLEFGGHRESGGFSSSNDSIHTLETELQKAFALVKKTETKKEKNEMIFDEELSLDDVNWKTYEEVAIFAPFGSGNPKPQFFLRGISIFGVRRFGRDREHIEVIFRNSQGTKISAISFFAPDEYFERLKRGETIDLIATLERSVFRKSPELRLRIVKVG